MRTSNEGQISLNLELDLLLQSIANFDASFSFPIYLALQLYFSILHLRHLWNPQVVIDYQLLTALKF